MKTNLKKFYCGKLKKDELVSRNTALLREISSAAKRYRCFVIPSVPQVYASAISGSQKQTTGACGLPASVYATLYGSYTFDSFSAAYSSVSGRTVYILSLGKVVAYYAPATGKLHFDFLDYMPHLVPARGCPQQGACAGHSAEQADASGRGTAQKDSPVLVRVHMLQKPDEYVFMLVSRECTIGDLLDEICHTAADHGVTHLQASPQSRSAPESMSSGGGSTDSAGSSGSTPALSPLGPLGPVPLRGARAVFTSSGSMQLLQQQRVKFVSATSSFWRELGKLGNKVQSETTRSRLTSSGHRRSLSYQFRLNGSQLALARVSAGAQETGELKFLQITRPRATKVLNCFAQADVDRASPGARADAAPGDGPCPSLYLYGAVTRADDVTCSLAPKTLSPGAVAFLVSLLGADSSSSSSSSTTTGSGSAAPAPLRRVAALCELSTLFQGLRDLLPVAIEGAQDLARSRGVRDLPLPRSAAAGSAALAPLQPAASRSGRFSSLRGLFGLTKEHRSSGSSGSSSSSSSSGNSGSSSSAGVQTVARGPVVLLVSQALQVVPWEAVLVDHVVLRYWSFFDLVRAVGAAQDATAALAVEPAYTALFWRAADERAAAAHAHARLAYQRGCVAAQLRAAAAPPEMSRAGAGACGAQCPLVEATKRGAAVPRKRYRGLDFVDLGAVREQPQLLWEHVAVRAPTFPVLVVTYADLADPPALLTALLRARPCAAVLGVPRGAARAVVQRLCAQHEVVAKQYHRPVPPAGPDDPAAPPRDRYQFLLAVVAAAQAASPVPIAVLNAPPPLPVPGPSSSSSSSSSRT